MSLIGRPAPGFTLAGTKFLDFLDKPVSLRVLRGLRMGTCVPAGRQPGEQTLQGAA
jgi:hypothetical protein